MSRLIRNQQLPQLLDNSLGHSELLKLLKMGNWTEYVVFNLKLCRTKLSSLPLVSKVPEDPLICLFHTFTLQSPKFVFFSPIFCHKFTLIWTF